MHRLLFAPLLIAPLMIASLARAECPEQAVLDRLAENLLANRPSPAITGMTSLADGYCAQAKLLPLLERHWGRPVGYKLGLTAAANQRLFGVDSPLRGTLFEHNVSLRSGAEVPANFAAVPRVEADFLLRVRDDGINEAGRDHLAILRHIDQIIPFIELPDLVLNVRPDGPNLVAVDVGAHLGVQGTPIPVEATPELVARLGSMTVTTSDDTGKQLAQEPGSAVLGHPLNAVAFLIEDLARSGQRLRAGQLLSVAGYSAALPIEAGRTYTVRYTGLVAEPVAVTVQIR